MSKFSQQGVSLYLAVIIMAILLAIVLGMSTILLEQLKMVRGMENSVIAFYAADTGIEIILDKDEWCRTQTPPCDAPFKPCAEDGNGDGFCDGVKTDYNPNGTLENGAEYTAEVLLTNGFKSAGTYRGTKRAIEITY